MNFAGPNRRGGKPMKYRLTKKAEALIRERYKPQRRDSGRREIAADLGVPAGSSRSGLRSSACGA